MLKTDEDAKLHHYVDHVLIRDQQIFAYGWGFVPGDTISKLTFVIHFKKKQACLELEVDYGQQRDDVTKKYTGIPEAINSGFLFLAEITSKRVKRIVLYWELESGRILKTPVKFRQTDADDTSISRLGHIVILAKKSLQLLRAAGPKALINKVKRYNTGRPQSVDSANWKNLTQNLQTRPLSIVVDHDIGGGANIYRFQYIADRIALDEQVLLFGFHIASLQYYIELYDGENTVRYSIASVEAFVNLLKHVKIQHVLYNCAVSFRDPLKILRMLVTLRKHVHCDLQVVIHDYFAICPSHFLLNDRGNFCNVPDEPECKRCLGAHKDGFVSVTGVRDIVKWRAAWTQLLMAADDVCLFSLASKRLLQRAYPNVSQLNWRITPHKLHTPVTKVNLKSSTHLHIGIVGLIGKHKGAEIVSELAREIQRRNVDIKITVIGSIEARVSNQVVQATGPYLAENLSKIIEESGINVFLFPSIWGETFSYVTHELVAMDVPVACFDFGAPTDLLKSYKKGLVLSSMQAPNILDELEDFWRTVYLEKKDIVWMREVA